MLLARVGFYGLETCFGSISSKFSFKIFALKWVNCFLLTTLKPAVRDGQLTLTLIFPGKKVIRHHIASSQLGAPGCDLVWSEPDWGQSKGP